MKKELIKIAIKVLLYALGLLAAYFGVSPWCLAPSNDNLKVTA